MTRRILLFAIICLLLPAVLSAQQPALKVYLLTKKVEPGTVFSAPIRTVGFRNLVSAQFTVKWDSSVLSLLGATGLNLPGLTPLQFGVQDTTKGRMYFAWENYATGKFFVLPDTGSLFTLQFFAKGAPDSFTDLKLASTPVQIEFGDSTSTAVAVTIFNGVITINGPLATQEISASTPDFEQLTAYPNPLQERNDLQIRLTTKHDVPVFVEVTDASGRIIHTTNRKPDANRNTVQIALPASIFPTAGSYQLRLYTDRQQQTVTVLKL